MKFFCLQKIRQIFQPNHLPFPPCQPTVISEDFLRAQFEKPLLKSGDNLWFFFAGHGRRDRERDYLMLSDSDPGDVEHTAISVDYITQRLRKSGADNVILFLDACRDESRRGEGIKGEYKGVVTFYSCSPNQRAYEIDRYQHGSFTYALLEGLRIQGEGNCATVERLERHLKNRVPQITSKYWKEQQNPYASAEPATKLHLILLFDYATLTDINNLKIDAYEAEAEQDWELAKQLWIRVNVAARGSDLQAIKAFSRIDRLQGQASSSNHEPVNSTPESATPSRGEKVEISETVVQREEQHQQNLIQYQQSLSQAVRQEFPLNESSLRKLRDLQQSLQLTDEEVLQIKQPIFAQKEAEERKRREKIRQQQEAERLQRQREEAERLRKQQEAESRQKLQQYKQELIKITEREFPLSEASKRRLIEFQQSLQLNDEEVLQIKQTILTQKETEYRQRQEAERIRQQQETERLQRQWEEAKLLRQQQEIQREEIQTSQLQVFEFEVVEVEVQRSGLFGWGSKVTLNRTRSHASYFTEDLDNGITLEMVSIPGGKFLMGTEDQEIERLCKKYK